MTWNQIRDSNVGPRFGTPIWDPDLGHPHLGPRFGTPMSLAKIKQNSSDMNEIILVPCDAGYVQNCTGFKTCLYKLCQKLNIKFKFVSTYVKNAILNYVF
jgi:hypothetical protein